MSSLVDFHQKIKKKLKISAGGKFLRYVEVDGSLISISYDFSHSPHSHSIDQLSLAVSFYLVRFTEHENGIFLTTVNMLCESQRCRQLIEFLFEITSSI